MNEKIAVMTDSSALITNEQKAKYSHLFVVPLILIRSDGTEIVDDLTKANSDLFYKCVAQERISTSQIAIGMMNKYWKQLLATYDKIIFLGLSKGISGQHTTMTALAQEPEFKKKVFVVDTQTCAWPLNFLVIQTLEHLPLFFKDYDAFCGKIKQWQDLMQCYLLLQSVETLKQGGRISPSVAALVKMTKIMPILKFEHGSLVRFAKTRTFKGGFLKIVAKIPKQKLSEYECRLLLTNQDEPKVQSFVECLQKYPFQKVIVDKLPKVVVAHSGLETIGVILYHKNNQL